MKNTASFWDKIADRYARTPVRNEEAYQNKLAMTRAYLTPDAQVFEFGCGTGSTAIAHAPHVQHITAIDISGRMLEIARGKAAAADIGNITFTQASLEDVDTAPASFDMVMAHSILHLVQDPAAACRRLYDLLKPGGVLVTSTTCIGDASPFWKFVIPPAHFLGFAPFVNIFTRQALLQAIASAGFTLTYQSAFNRKEAAFIIATKPDANTGTPAAGQDNSKTPDHERQH
jgi:ubiquinone/menaquinone biosynthesis C-methylase UbiE